MSEKFQSARWNMIRCRHDNILFTSSSSGAVYVRGQMTFALAVPMMNERWMKRKEKYWIKHIFRSLFTGCPSHSCRIIISCRCQVTEKLKSKQWCFVRDYFWGGMNGENDISLCSERKWMNCERKFPWQTHWSVREGRRNLFMRLTLKNWDFLKFIRIKSRITSLIF